MMDRTKRLLAFQRNEITEHLVYEAYARRAEGRNREVLEKMAADERRHYDQFKRYTNQDVEPDHLRVLFYRLCATVFGLTFGIKLMESGEQRAEQAYACFRDDMPEIVNIIAEEARHEHGLIAMLNEDKLKYMRSMVLALNNSIQEFSGIAAGLTFAMGNTRLIGSTVLVSGLAATLAMSASEYLSHRSEAHTACNNGTEPLKAVLYAGSLYLMIVMLIVIPYFVFDNCHVALGVAMASVAVILLFFTFFVAVVKGLRYSKVLLESLLVCLCVVALSFLIGTLAKRFLGAGH